MPARKTLNVTTIRDGQTKMVINVYEGERVFVRDNSFVGALVIEGLKEGPKEKVLVEVMLEFDANGRLAVRASGIEESGSGVEGVWKVNKDLPMWDWSNRDSEQDWGKRDWEAVSQILVDAEKFKEKDEMERAKFDGGTDVGEDGEFGFVIVPTVVEEMKRTGWWSGRGS